VSRIPDPAGPVFHALADPTRRRMVGYLAEGETLTATELGERLSMSRQAAAKHLSLLAEAGLVESARTGKEVRYRLTPRPFSDAVTWMADVGGEWDERLARLGRFLDGRRRR